MTLVIKERINNRSGITVDGSVISVPHNFVTGSDHFDSLSGVNLVTLPA